MSEHLDMNISKATITPVNLCNSFKLVGGLRSYKAWIFSRFSSIPYLLTMKPKNFLEFTLKVQLVAFNFIL